MGIVFDTIVVRFGDGTSDTAYAKVFLDPIGNKTDAGEDKNSISANEQVDLVLHMEPGLVLARVELTDGDYSIERATTRTDVIRAFFPDDDSVVTLPYFPSSTIESVWFGRQSSLKQTNRSLKSVRNPAIGDLTYKYPVIPIKIFTPNVELNLEESYPLGIVVWVKEA